jgi:hypothetical protein
MTIEDLIRDKYYETDVPELLITENAHIERISKQMFESIRDSLKKSFKEKEIISHLEEDYNFIEKLTGITDELLYHMIRDIGHYKIAETKSENIHPMWYLNPHLK